MTADSRASGFGVVAIASSAGGIRALGTLLGALDPALPVPVLVVQHLDRKRRSLIAEVLGRQSALPVKLAEHHERIQLGTVYVAPPNRHLLVGPTGLLRLSESQPVHFVRPSADLLFGAVSSAYGSRALACVLTGSGVDGAAGVLDVKERGGTVIAQDPRTAEFAGMPQAAVNSGAVDLVLSLEEIAEAVHGLVGTTRQ
ncbi:chemotaxis protein CheB [Streptomyces sp. NPDC020707]|uniref:protein-glutamate methylesterase n=1 Tax=Streptomyces ortus TaxID=2867268 RepID=A0ABT3VAI5_9ACTN|nr:MULTISPECIES: chemotaxis protein CheB [Streptomyces]MCX4236967.1 chemotaxis protein CheB [Streptomyces ortus]